MIYQNPRTGISIDLTTLGDEEERFYRAAKQRFESGIAWFDFDDFAFGSNSPLYRGRASHHEVLQHPLYIVLKDMWLELGVRQGRVRADAGKGIASGSRRTKGESGKAAHERNRAKTRNVAVAYTSARAGH
ncbi:MAG: hypothetical protein WA188_03400 [Terriglobales bacterium]